MFGRLAQCTLWILDWITVAVERALGTACVVSIASYFYFVDSTKHVPLIALRGLMQSAS